MKRVILIICSLTAILSFFTSCDEGDTVKPVIELVSPADGAVLEAGSAIHLEMVLEDNEMLSSYKIDIHEAAGHEHDTKAESADETAFTFSKSWNVSGSKNAHVHHHEIIIPENAEHGEYHFMVYCTDASGNEVYVVRTITISEAP